MSWLKLDVDFPDHPKVLGLADWLKIDRNLAAGILVRWFAWVRKYYPDGDVETALPEIPGISPEISGRLPEALREVGWVVDGWVKNWDEWGGAEIAEKAKREPDKYRKMIDFYGLFPYGKNTGKIGKKTGKIPSRREEKRIEEKRIEKDKTIPPATPDLPTLNADAFWKKHESTHGSKPTWTPGRTNNALKKLIEAGVTQAEFDRRVDNHFNDPFLQTHPFDQFIFGFDKWVEKREWVDFNVKPPSLTLKIKPDVFCASCNQKLEHGFKRYNCKKCEKIFCFEHIDNHGCNKTKEG